MKLIPLMLLVTAAAVAPLYFRAMSEKREPSAALRIEQMENDLAQAQQDIGELKQQIQILLKRDSADD